MPALSLSTGLKRALAVALGVNGDALATEVETTVGALTPTVNPAVSQNAYIRTDSGTKDLLAAAAVARTVIINVNVTTVFANGDGAQPTLTLDEESTAAKFAAAARFTGAAVGGQFTYMGVLAANKKLQATLVAATGSTSTGAYTITAQAVSNT